MSKPGNWDIYSYCNNDPVNFVDPSGHFAVSTGLFAVGAINAGAMGAAWLASKAAMWLGGTNTPQNNANLNKAMMVGVGAGFTPAAVVGGGQLMMGAGRFAMNSIYEPAMYTMTSMAASNPQRFSMGVENTIDFLDNFSGNLGGPTTGTPPTTAGGRYGYGASYMIDFGMNAYDNFNSSPSYIDDGFRFYDSTPSNDQYSFGTWEF